MSGELNFDVGSDIGGTFTDLWVRATDGSAKVVKVPTSPDIVGGMIAALELAAQAYGLEPPQFCRRIKRFGHGTTVGLNALLTGRAGRTALITTRGFADTIEIGRMKRQFSGLTETEVSDYTKRNLARPIVPRQLVREVAERVDRTGAVLSPLDEADARAVIRSLAGDEVDAVAVCTLWSTANPAHENRLRELLSELAPGKSVSVSHEVAASVGEYARMSTTAVNAALKPVTKSYATRLRSATEDLGLQAPLMLMTGTGGAMPAEYLAELPVAALLSGPVGGVVACQQLGRMMGRDRILATDIGGTSFDVGLVVDGSPLMASEFSFGGADLRIPCIDVRSIGAGGGSIASVAFGELTVGPQSAGAQPGPACYGRGGTAPTATDADLILGVLAAENLGSGIFLDRQAAARAISTHIAEPLGIGLEHAAWGIRQVLDNRMADLLRQVTIQRGYDPREFTMFANGGCGPSHGWVLARELGISEFVIPAAATTQSAFGTAVCDIRVTSERPVYLRLAAGGILSVEEVEQLRAAVAEAVTEATNMGFGELEAGPAEVVVTVAVRYLGQSHHLRVPVTGGEITARSVRACVDRFEQEYERLYGRGAGFRGAGFELLGAGALVTRGLETELKTAPGEPLQPCGTRLVWFDDPSEPVPTDVYAVEFPAAGQRVAGPCLITYPGQTAVVPPGSVAETDAFGNLIVQTA